VGGLLPAGRSHYDGVRVVTVQGLSAYPSILSPVHHVPYDIVVPVLYAAMSGTWRRAWRRGRCC
jgi:hypothetical protein